jgi:tetratricopeptide (TPR) repeat protein
LEEVIEEKPDFYDAHVLLGMFYYYADRLGGIIGFIAGILGFSGDRAEGIEYMKVTAEKGEMTKPQANMLLAELYSRLEENKFKSFPYFKTLVESFPSNSYFLNWYVRELLGMEMVKEVDQILQSDTLNLIDDYNKGRYYHLIGEYNLSQSYLTNYRKVIQYQWGWFSGGALFISVLNDWMLGNKEKAIADTSQLRRRYQEEFEKILSNENGAKKFFEFKTSLIKNGNVDQVVYMIENRTKEEDSYLEGIYLLYSGKYYFYQNDYSKAEKYLLMAMSINDEIKYECSKFLIELYQRIEVTEEKVEFLLDIIDDLDSERLEWSTEDLIIKYNL